MALKEEGTMGRGRSCEQRWQLSIHTSEGHLELVRGAGREREGKGELEGRGEKGEEIETTMR